MLSAGAGVAIAAAVLLNVYAFWIIRAMWVRRNEMLIRARSPALAIIECLAGTCSTPGSKSSCDLFSILYGAQSHLS
jgi:hypothetical protein